MRTRTLLLGLAAAAVLAAVAGCHSKRAPLTEDDLPEVLMMTPGPFTAFKYEHTGPPPWPDGNTLYVNAWREPWDGPTLTVVNMHADNYGCLADQLELKELQVRRLGNGLCLVVDPRVPREWLRARPQARAGFPEGLWAAHADHFAPR